MSEVATVLYDFEGLIENNEITLTAGETLTVTNKNVGDGWWEGRTPDGRSGLFPEAYVELTVAPNTVPDTFTSPRYSEPPGENYAAQLDYNQPDGFATAPALSNAPQYDNGNNYNDDDAWSEDWDESSTVASTMMPTPIPGSAKQYGNEAHDVASLNSVESKSARVPGSVSKRFNRFSSFVKHGGEDFMLGKADARVRQVDQIPILIQNDSVVWQENDHKFGCTIENPKQQSKMKGFKKFVCYNLTPSDTAVTVQRRYKHFDWLYDRLVERYSMIAIPRLPDKQAAGRFEEDFIEARMARLQLWSRSFSIPNIAAQISYICKHPVLSKAQLFRNFLTLTEQKAWKMSKRQAEKDELVAGNFFLTISIPPAMPPSTEAEVQLEQFKKFAKSMDEGVAQLSSAASNMSHKHQGVVKRDYHTVGKSLQQLAAAFGMPEAAASDPALTSALHNAGQTYIRVGDLTAAQPKNDYIPLIDTLWLHKGLIDTMPDLWHIQSGALRKVRECRKLVEEGKMTDADCGAVMERSDRVVGCMMAEVRHFHGERERDVARAARDFLKCQADFFEQVTRELRQAQAQFDELLSCQQH